MRRVITALHSFLISPARPVTDPVSTDNILPAAALATVRHALGAKNPTWFHLETLARPTVSPIQPTSTWQLVSLTWQPPQINYPDLRNKHHSF
jgi:hypothetical protein